MRTRYDLGILFFIVSMTIMMQHVSYAQSCGCAPEGTAVNDPAECVVENFCRMNQAPRGCSSRLVATQDEVYFQCTAATCICRGILGQGQRGCNYDQECAEGLGCFHVEAVSGQYTECRSSCPEETKETLRVALTDPLRTYTICELITRISCNFNGVCEQGETANSCSDCQCNPGIWVNDACGGAACAPSQMHQTRQPDPNNPSCTYTERCIAHALCEPQGGQQQGDACSPPENGCFNDGRTVCQAQATCGEYTDCSRNTVDHLNGQSDVPTAIRNGATFSTAIKKYGTHAAFMNDDTHFINNAARNPPVSNGE